MLNVKEFYELLIEKDIRFFTGVPDSLLKEFCAFVSDNAVSGNHIINANEGCSIALASGYYLATNKIALVYMQNSGFGNAMNPLLSLADPDVYGIPILLLIGWRGEPGKKDEPQHVKQGRVTIPLLETLGIPHDIIDGSLETARIAIVKAYDSMRFRNCPYALVVREGTFAPYKVKKIAAEQYTLNREEALKSIINNLNKDDVVVSTTGMLSRELFEYREALGQGHENDFLTVGSMGHASQIALSIALQKPNRNVYCLDGDGAVIMHMGSLAIIGSKSPNNFKHIIFNNGAHDSVGGQPTVGLFVNFCKIAEGCNYKTIFTAQTRGQIELIMKDFRNCKGPALLEIKINKGYRDNLGRPTTTPIENKIKFMSFLNK